jgi:sarcosine/dimethylglycine N-methyltransferase
MSTTYSPVVETARQYYNSDDADNFYFHVWGGEDIHIGLYSFPGESITTASRRTVQYMADEVVQELGPHSQVLDVGAGYGGAARYLADTYGCQVTALNLSEKENERNREMNRALSLDQAIDVVDGSFESIPAEDASFDLAWSQDAILHSGHRDRVIGEIARVLRPGGELIFTDPMQADDCPEGVLQPVLDRIHLDSLGSIAFYREAAARHGLEEVQIVELTNNLVVHYDSVRDELARVGGDLAGKVSDAYIERMLAGLGHWVDAAEKGYLRWGILHFRKPAG